VRKDDSGWRRHVERLMSAIRGRYISMIFQNPKSALNPYIPVGRQIAESVRLHTDVQEPKAARERALHWLERVRIDSPRLRYDNFPYGLSGGMCQRAMIAMALSSEPKLLIADEPTTGLDATIQSRIVDLLEELKSELSIATLLISHDISVIRRLADRVTVMYGGTVVESGPVGKVLAADSAARHPYTAALLASIPTTAHIQSRAPLPAIEGEVLDTINVPRGCRFYARCNRVNDVVRSSCQGQEPPLAEIEAGHAVRCWLFAGRVIA
jgi:oligopeptide/dipeptide ABC transporter ATP-binding protein